MGQANPQSATSGQPTQPTQPTPPRLPMRGVDLLWSLRPHQWAKNLLIFIPLITSHNLDDPDRLLAAVVVFIGFSLCVSSVYLLNDVLDRRTDRLHPDKSRRPIASGRVSVPWALGLGAGVLVAGLAVVATLRAWLLIYMIAGYLLLNLAYSWRLKRRPVVDVLLLAGFYAFRVVLGGVAIEVAISQWLLAFSMFLFLSLAMAKRCTDLLALRSAGRLTGKSHGYAPEDLDVLTALGSGSGYLSVLVLALYINDSPLAAELYQAPELLWMACPLLLYWITRLWFLVQRRSLHTDPVVFALKDRTSYVVAAVMAIVLLIASRGW